MSYGYSCAGQHGRQVLRVQCCLGIICNSLLKATLLLVNKIEMTVYSLYVATRYPKLLSYRKSRLAVRLISKNMLDAGP